MILAPHPDDESLATGGLLQRAAQAGVATHVIFLTDGDNNPWPQRVIERRWRVSGAEGRTRWGASRRAEALAALLTLGHDPAAAEFWALPDQGLTGLLLSGGAFLFADLCKAITAWQPSHLVVPSSDDRHPDHSALGIALDIALRWMAGAGRMPSPVVLSYIVHGKPDPARGQVLGLSLDATETEGKRRAILCHRSQILLSRRRFLAHARTEEMFLKHPAIRIPAGGHPIRRISWDEHGLRIDFEVTIPSQIFGALRLHLLAESAEKTLRHICLPVPGCRGVGKIRVSPMAFHRATQRVFAKLENAFGLYGSFGWVEQEIRGA